MKDLVDACVEACQAVVGFIMLSVFFYLATLLAAMIVWGEWIAEEWTVGFGLVWSGLAGAAAAAAADCSSRGIALATATTTSCAAIWMTLIANLSDTAAFWSVVGTIGLPIALFVGLSALQRGFEDPAPSLPPTNPQGGGEPHWVRTQRKTLQARQQWDAKWGANLGNMPLSGRKQWESQGRPRRP